MHLNQQNQGLLFTKISLFFFFFSILHLFSFFSHCDSEEQEQICRDLIQALSTPRPVSRGNPSGVFSPEASLTGNGDVDSSKEEIFQSVLSRLRNMLTTTEE